jgi:hypothetical protein
MQLWAGGSGAVYVFRRTGTTWQQQVYVKASNADGGDFFGSSVALAGDTLVVGALTRPARHMAWAATRPTTGSFRAAPSTSFNDAAPASFSDEAAGGRRARDSDRNLTNLALCRGGAEQEFLDDLEIDLVWLRIAYATLACVRKFIAIGVHYILSKDVQRNEALLTAKGDLYGSTLLVRGHAVLHHLCVTLEDLEAKLAQSREGGFAIFGHAIHVFGDGRSFALHGTSRFRVPVG